VDAVFADLGLSSMQIDDPARGFTWKENGPLDMRLNPQRGVSAGKLLAGMSEEKLVKVLTENADEPLAREVAAVMAGREFAGTMALAEAVRGVVAPVYRLRVGGDEEVQRTIRRHYLAISQMPMTCLTTRTPFSSAIQFMARGAAQYWRWIRMGQDIYWNGVSTAPAHARARAI
jgi:hypothetical protein